MDARHRGDLTAHFLTRAGKQRQDEIFRRQARFAHEGAHGFSSTKTTRALNDVSHEVPLVKQTVSLRL